MQSQGIRASLRESGACGPRAVKAKPGAGAPGAGGASPRPSVAGALVHAG